MEVVELVVVVVVVEEVVVALMDEVVAVTIGAEVHICYSCKSYNELVIVRCSLFIAPVATPTILTIFSPNVIILIILSCLPDSLISLAHIVLLTISAVALRLLRF